MMEAVSCVVCNSYHDILEKWKTFAPFDQFVEPLVRHPGDGRAGHLTRGQVTSGALVVSLSLMTRLAAEPEMLHLHDLHQQVGNLGDLGAGA